MSRVRQRSRSPHGCGHVCVVQKYDDHCGSPRNVVDVTNGEDVADSSDGDVVGNADLRPNWNVRRASDVSDDQHVNLGFFKRDDQRRKLGMSMNGSDNHVASPLNSGTKDPDVLFKRLTIMTPVVKLFSMFLLVMFIKPIGMVKRNGV